MTRKRSRGRPSSFDEATASKLVTLLQIGNLVDVACAAVGVPRATFYHWTSTRPDFRERIEQARAGGKAHNVALIARGARRDWRAAAWILERTDPELWCLR